MTQYALTSQQKNILNLQRFYGSTSITNICGAVLFEEKFDRTLLENAINEEIRLQDGMRLRFCEKDGETVQYIDDYCYKTFDFITFDCYDDFTRFGEEYACKPFESSDGEMFRITAFELNGKSGVLLCASHLISDAWSCSLLAGDIYYICGCLKSGKDVDLPKCSYIGHIESERKYFSSERFERDKAYWEEKYACGAEQSCIKLTRTGNISPKAKRYTAKLSSTIIEKINGFIAENGLSRAVVFETAMLIYLSKINPENRSVTIGVPILNRNSVAEKRTAGMFISTMPLSVSISDKDTVLSVCKKTANGHKRIFRHRKYPYDEILRCVRKNNANTQNLYDVMVSCQNAETGINADTIWFSNGYNEVPFTLHIDNRDGLSDYSITIDYRVEVFPQEDEIALITHRLEHIIGSITADGSATLSEISVLPREEYEKVIFGFNETQEYYRYDCCISGLFTEKAAVMPDAAALIFENEEFTYRRLDEMSNSLAHFLRDKGVKPNDIIPIAAERSPLIIVAMLGILKAGGAFMPISPSYPSERVGYMLETAEAKYALAYGCKLKNITQVDLGSFDFLYNIDKIDNANRPDDLCYVIFTSGSTGKPKGVTVTHKNVANYCAESKFNVYGRIIGRNLKSIVSVTNFIFDIFVTESILALLCGIKIYLANDRQSVSQEAFGKLITDSGAEIIQTTPTKMKSYIFNDSNLTFLKSLKIIMLGGEEFSAELYQRLRRHTSAEIYNVYGPAETTVWSALKCVGNGNFSIGRPIANTQIYILDKLYKPLPTGVAGELCISGDGVAKGYINRPDLTAERFLPNPFICGKMLYRTGDLARILPDGEIEFLGRIDTQVKIHGLRIELGEIENAISGFDGIRLTAVTDKHSENGRHYLAAYYTSDEELNNDKLREYLSARLPAYMIPNYFTRLQNMPLTASGKTDRKNLPEPENTKSNEEYSAPKTSTETILCEILAELLEVERVGATDDFFAMGGDSLSALEYVARARKSGIEFSLQSIFECRSVRELCRCLADGGECGIQADYANGYPTRRTKNDERIFRLFMRFTKLTYKFEVSGLENLRCGERYIFCPNHESDLDCMWVWMALENFAQLSEKFALIASEHLCKAIPRRVFRITGGIPLDRSGDFTSSLNRAAKAFDEGYRCLLIHPEGTRTRTGELGRFKLGAAMLSIKTGVKVIPVCIDGAHDIFPPNRKVPRMINRSVSEKYPLRITFGTPIDTVGKSPARITDEIRGQIIKMKSEGKR